MQHNHGVRIGFRHGLDQLVLAGRHPHVLPVVALGFIGVRQSGEHYRSFSFLCRGHRLRDHLRGRLVLRYGITGGISHLQPLRRFQRADGFKAVDMAAAAALETGFPGELADEGDLILLVQRQDSVFIFQQHHALRGDICRLGMLRLLVPGRLRFRFFQIAGNNIQDPLAGPVHQLLVQLSGFDRFNNLFVVHAAGRRHLQVQSRRDAGHPVGHGAPVGHNISLKAPFLPEHVCQQPRVFRGVDAVDPIIGAHDRPGLCFLHRHFKSREIDLPDRPLIRVRGGAHPPVFLAVEGEVLDARAHIPALDALNDGCGHPPRQIRIFGEILEVPAAQGAALDVHRRAQHHGQLLMLAAVADGFSHLPDHIRVKGSRGGAGRREAHRLNAVVDAQMIRRLILLPQAVGAVADHGARNPEPLHRLGMPEVIAGAQAGFFFQGHL